MQANPRYLLLAAWLGLCALALPFACHREAGVAKSTQTRIYREIAFEPKLTQIGRVLPGSYPGLIRFRNLSGKPIHNVQIRTSCSCLVPKSSASHAIMDIGETQDIAFTMKVSGREPQQQFITVSSPDLRNEFFTYVLAAPVPPLPDVENMITLPPLSRRGAGVNSVPVVWKTTFSPVARTISLSCGVPWLHVRSRQTASDLVITVQADALAPDGAFTVPVQLNYASDASTQSMTLALKGSVISRVRVEPDLLSFGMVSSAQVAPVQACIVQTEQAQQIPVTVTCRDKRVSVEAVQQSAGQISFHVRLMSSQPGEVRTSVEVKQGNTLLVAVPVTAFVQRLCQVFSVK